MVSLAAAPPTAVQHLTSQQWSVILDNKWSVVLKKGSKEKTRERAAYGK